MSSTEQDKIIEQLIKTNKLLFKYSSLRYTFLRGLITGFGIFLGATLLIAFFVAMLTRLQFVPILGKFASEIIAIVEENKKIKTNNNNYPVYPYNR